MCVCEHHVKVILKPMIGFKVTYSSVCSYSSVSPEQRRVVSRHTCGLALSYRVRFATKLNERTYMCIKPYTYRRGSRITYCCSHQCRSNPESPSYQPILVSPSHPRITSRCTIHNVECLENPIQYTTYSHIYLLVLVSSV